MIGVSANPTEHAVVREFFELFKTPWEFYRSDRRYDVLLCSGNGEIPEGETKLILIYSGLRMPVDAEQEIEIASQERNACILSYGSTGIPIYGESITFRKGSDMLFNEGSGHAAMYQRRSSTEMVVRIGYDLFREIRQLLTAGQPIANAGIPALELHISLLRDLIVATGIPLIEIPPVPLGYRFLACLTHDVDHPSLRQHKFDHTMFGFLYRATLGSLLKVFRGRLDVRGLLSNVAAALKLPLVHMGLAEDIWSKFDRYAQIEKGLASTFFVIPFKDRPGVSREGVAPSQRASRYGASDISVQIQELIAAGCAIGTHGIDAWIDSSKGRAELGEVRRIAGPQAGGVRMHWLYFDDRSPAALEEAGAEYDSTIGYNETIGYRAGTTQVYKPLEVERLLELPMHVMDTALFYPNYLDLSAREAGRQVGHIIENAVRFGGCVTVNWHDRSIAPERLWDDFYIGLVNDLKAKGAWFSTAPQAVSWFRKRRSVVFEDMVWESGKLHLKIAVDQSDDLPDLEVRTYNGGKSQSNTAVSAATGRMGKFDDEYATRTADFMPARIQNEEYQVEQ
jgi:hypothetical protein